MSQKTDLQIRVISHLSTTQQVLLYQQDIQSNVKNFLTAAWEHPHIAPKARYDVVLPVDISVSAGAPPIFKSPYHPAGSASSGQPLHAPTPSKLYVALSDTENHGASFDAAALPSPPISIDYEGQKHLTITLNEGPDGKVSVQYSFAEFQ